jgi:hypothetical protein
LSAAIVQKNNIKMTMQQADERPALRAVNHAQQGEGAQVSFKPISAIILSLKKKSPSLQIPFTTAILKLVLNFSKTRRKCTVSPVRDKASGNGHSM